jgi:cyclohexyl-isocyanide hydratase
VIPGGKGRHQVLACDESVRFLMESCKNAQDILAVCTGSLILNALSLINGRQATTHWEFIDELKRNSSVTVMAGPRFVRDGHVWTAAGVFSGVDLALAYIDSFTGSATQNGLVRKGDAGKVQVFSEYIPDQRAYAPEMDLSGAPEHIRKVFS